MSFSGKLSRSWDAFDAYLFDIDGTLLNCRDAVHYFAFCDALSQVAGRPLNLDGVVTHGNTDEGILRDAFALGEIEESAWRARMPEVRERMGAQVEANRGDLDMEILPGAHEVLAHLRERGAVLSTATGNLSRIGEAKLQHGKLLTYFHHGGYSDGCETRSEVFRRALARVRQAAGAEAAVCVFGDTPADIEAAHQNGLEVIAVATGIFSRAELEALSPELCLNSLTELVEEQKTADAAVANVIKA
jgi:phosphoglycolate phosphatase-like HAD superfamily hydrolase